jgi:DNA-directed RNA polymerase sigma subunit (sigma70/sigma32)
MGKRGRALMISIDYVKANWGKLTLEKIGEHEGVSKQRIDQLARTIGLPRLQRPRVRRTTL